MRRLVRRTARSLNRGFVRDARRFGHGPLRWLRVSSSPSPRSTHSGSSRGRSRKQIRSEPTKLYRSLQRRRPVHVCARLGRRDQFSRVAARPPAGHYDSQISGGLLLTCIPKLLLISTTTVDEEELVSDRKYTENDGREGKIETHINIHRSMRNYWRQQRN